MDINSKVNFAVKGSLVDLISGQIPVYLRSTPLWVERYLNDSLIFDQISEFHPAILYNGAFYLEPAGFNLVTNSLALDTQEWIKGDNVQVRRDRALGVSRTREAEQVTWSYGSGETQVLRRTFKMTPGVSGTLSAVLRLVGGQLGANDVIRLTSGVNSSEQINLIQLNQHIGKNRILEIPFRVSGRRLEGRFANNNGTIAYSVVNVTSTEVTIQGDFPDDLEEDELTGTMLLFNPEETFYEIISNTGGSGGQVTITVDGSSDLVADGVDTTSTVVVYGSPTQEVTLEVYVESTVTIDISGIQLEPSPYRTSMVFQGNSIKSKDRTELIYENSPIAELTSFAVFMDIEEWRGDGRLFSAGNVYANINNGNLVVGVGTIILTYEQLNQFNRAFKFLLQVDSSQRKIKLYVDGTLVAEDNLVNEFIASSGANFNLTPDSGVRAYNAIATANGIWLDGGIALNRRATGEVAEVFKGTKLITQEDLANRTNRRSLPTIEVPAATDTVEAIITAVKPTQKAILVSNSNIFSQGDSVGFARMSGAEREKIGRTKILDIQGKSLVLESLPDIKTGDYVVNGELGVPGRASVRYPFTPINIQPILDIDSNSKRLLLNSSTAFIPNERLFVTGTKGEDVNEVSVTAVDQFNRTIDVSSIERLEVGQFIAQPQFELLIPPANCFVVIPDSINRVAVERRFYNAVQLVNYNPFPTEVQVDIIVNL